MMGGTAMMRWHDNGDGRHGNGDGWHDDAVRLRHGRRRFDNNNDGMMMGDRKPASAVPTIQGNNQLMLIVGGEELREGDNCGE